MSSMLYQEAKKREDAMANFLKDIVSIPSLSSQEGDVVKFLENAMKEMGYEEVVIDGMGNLLGRIGNGPRVIAFDGHCDTVDIGDIGLWDKVQPYPGKIADGKVYGRGAADQKGGVTSSIFAVAMLKELNLIPEDLTIWVVASVQEEDCDGLCWQYIIQEGNLRPEVVVCTEPTSLQIYRGHRGRMEIEIETKGVSCHGSAPERGDNAVYKMADIIKDIEQLNERLEVKEPLGKGTVTISHIRSTSPSLCAVADSCTIHLDRRLTLGENEETSVAELNALPGVQKAKAEIRVLEYAVPSWTGLTYPTKKYFPTWFIPEETPYVQSAVKGFKDALGEDPVVAHWVFSTNGVSIAGMFGIPVIGFGPGHERFAHFPNEEIDIEHLTRAAAFYASFVLEYAKTDVPAK
ncbi:MAG: YgeY family selenium metabolism-linked hydrolase [Lentisphaerae bacterium]|nr:YgeY family selenium metabolism-linked hydrolase [Lentisphaerota bacterium]